MAVFDLRWTFSLSIDLQVIGRLIYGKKTKKKTKEENQRRNKLTIKKMNKNTAE